MRATSLDRSGPTRVSPAGCHSRRSTVQSSRSKNRSEQSHPQRTWTEPRGLLTGISCGDVSTAFHTVTQEAADVAGVAAPLTDVVAGVGCVSLPEVCLPTLGINTLVQEGFVGAQALRTRGYSASDALFAETSIVTADALGGLGALAGAKLGWIGKALLGSTVGYPQLLLDNFVLAQARAAELNCVP